MEKCKDTLKQRRIRQGEAERAQSSEIGMGRPMVQGRLGTRGHREAVRQQSNVAADSVPATIGALLVVRLGREIAMNTVDESSCGIADSSIFNPVMSRTRVAERCCTGE